MPLPEIDILVLGGLYEERQFIIIPGEVDVTPAANASQNYLSVCNRGTAVHVFDTYDWEFKSEFDPDNKGSKVPPVVFYEVGGDETGGAINKQPEAGWDDKALEDIFSIRNQLPLEDPNISSPTTTPSPLAQTHKSNKNVIIGGTIGGICAVVLIVGILIFFIKGYRKPDSDKVELDGTGHSRYELYPTGLERVELQGASYRRYELHAYEPPELMSQNLSK